MLVASAVARRQNNPNQTFVLKMLRYSRLVKPLHKYCTNLRYTLVVLLPRHEMWSLALLCNQASLCFAFR